MLRNFSSPPFHNPIKLITINIHIIHINDSSSLLDTFLSQKNKVNLSTAKFEGQIKYVFFITEINMYTQKCHMGQKSIYYRRDQYRCNSVSQYTILQLHSFITNP